LICSLLIPNCVWAQLPSPRLDRISPLGAAAGGKVELEIVGSDLEEPSLIFDHPGLSATKIEGKDRFFQISVSNEVPEGTFDCRVVGKYGISNPRLFAVHRGLVDVTEVEPNNSQFGAQTIQVSDVVFGMSDNNELDVFKIQLNQGVRVTIDCSAGRLDSMLDGTLTVVDAQGKQLAASSDYFGRDPMIDFIAPSTGDYWIVLHDLSYRGGLPYRLMVTTRPYVENVFPRVVQEGRDVTFKVLGRNLGAVSIETTKMVQDGKLFEASFTAKSPTDVLEFGKFLFLEHPAQHSVVPTASTCTVNGWQVRPEFDGVPSVNAINVMSTDLPITEEVEGNDNGAPQQIELPVAISGRFDFPRDADWYAFTVAENGNYSIDVYCERIAGQADPYVVIVDEQGNRVFELDDFGHRINAFDGHLRDPSGMVNLSQGKQYKALVQDRYQRGGPRYQYVMVLRPSRPDFFVATIHSQNPGPGGTNLWRGGAAYLNLIVHQTGGYNGPIVIMAENLPQGVHAVPTTVGLGSSGTFVLWADQDAPESAFPIRLIATGERGGEKLTREVRPYSRVWNQGDGTSQPMREHWIAVRDKAPFSLSFQESRIPVVAGEKVEVKLKLARLWESFKEPLNILPDSWPGNFKINSVQIPSGVDEVTATIEVQAGTRAGEYTLSVLGQGQVPFTKKPDGSEVKNTLVSLPSQPITLLVQTPEPAKK
jgi:hypothetical protein